ncbi:MAG: LysR substrate-binding domain-containing protein, partial [Rhodanobacteraceae bacterium]
HLRYFSVLAETLNFTRAAERAHVTQSTVSHQIKQLEEQIGTRLFDRIGKRVVMTQSGEVFLTFVMRALEEVDQGLGALGRDPAALTGLVRVGATHTFNLQFIPACVATFLGHYPSVKMSVDELAADAIDAGLKSDSLDIGIAYRPIGPGGLSFEPLYNEELVLAVSAAHPFAARRRIRMVELHRQKLVLLPQVFTTRQMLDECFNACGAEPLIAAEMNAIAPMLGLVERTTIGAIVSRNAVLPARALHAIPLENPTPIRTPGMLWKEDAVRSPLVKSFAAIVRKIALESARRPQLRAGRPKTAAHPTTG